MIPLKSKFAACLLTTVASAAGIGDYIAAGLGQANASGLVSTKQSSINAETSPRWSNATSVSGSHNSTATSHGTTTSHASATSHGSSAHVTGTSSRLITATGITKATTNVTTNGTLACWDQWTNYWSTETSSSLFTVTETTSYTWTSTSTEFSTYTGAQTSIETLAYTETVFEDPNDDKYPISTETQYETNTDIESGALIPISTVGTYTSAWTSTTVWSGRSAVNATNTPSCTLPSYVPQCQAQWNQWTPGGTPPKCSQASINSQKCSSVIAERFAGYTTGNPALNAWSVTEISLGPSSWTESSSWPATESLAPGCTLGCGTCAITGNTVQLYYWPPTTATLFENGNGTVTARASALSPNNSVPITAIVGGVTLTSPTIYISYDTIYASDSCSGIGRTITNTVIPISSNDLSSLAYSAVGTWAVAPGEWGVEQMPWLYVNQAFNLSDLIEPIPNNVYDKLPFCQRDLRGWEMAGWNESSFICSYGKLPYAPLIAMPTAVRNLDPAWGSCTAWYGGLFDPPKALQGATAVATPTLAVVAASTSASAGSTAKAGLPTETAAAQTTTVIPKTSAQTQGTGGGSTDAGAPTSKSHAEGPTASASNADPDETSAQQIDPTQADPTASASNADPDGTPAQQSDPTQAVSTQVDPSQSAANNATPTPASSTNAGGVIASLLGGSPTTNADSTSAQVLSSADPAATQAAADPTDPASIQQSPAQSEPASSGSNAATQTVGQPTDPAATSATTTDALGILASALSLDSAATTSPSAVVSNGGQSSGGLSVASASTSAGETVTIPIADPTAQNNGVSQGDPASSSASVVTLPEGQATTLSGIGAVVAQSSALVIAGTTEPYTNIQPQSTVELANVEITAGGQTYTAYQASGSAGVVNIVGDSSTLVVAQGGSSIINGQTVAVASNGIVIGSQTLDFSKPAAQATVASIGSQAFTIASQVGDASAIVVANGGSTTTLTPGGAQDTVGGQVISAAQSGGVVVGSGNFAQTVQLAQPTAQDGNGQQNAVTIGGQTLTASTASSGGIVLQNGQATYTVSANGAGATVGGQLVSAAPSEQLVVGSSTVDIASAQGSAAVLTLGSSVVTASVVPSESGAVVIGSNTLSAGGPAQTINGQIVSNGASGLVIGASTTIAASGSGAVLTLGSSVVTATGLPGESGVVVIDGNTLSAGSSAQTINGQIVSNGASGLVVGGSTTIALSGSTSPAPAEGATVLTIGGSKVTAAQVAGQTGEVIIDGTTLSAGGAGATIAGQVVSEEAGGLNLGGTITVALPQVTAGANSGVVLTLGSAQVTAAPISGQTGEVSIDGTTLSIGGPAQAISGHVISEGSAGLVIDGSNMVSSPQITAAAGSGTVLTIGSSVVTASAVPGQSGIVAIDGTTLSIGGPAQTIGGQTVSEGSSGLVIDGSRTVSLPQVTMGTESGILLTLGSAVVTASAVSGQSGVVAAVDGTNLSIGGPAQTVNGQIVSEGSSGLVIDGSRTISVPQIATGTESGLVLTLGGTLVTATAIPGKTGEVAIDGTTLSVGGPAETISGQVLSEGSSGLVVGGTTTMAVSRVSATPDITRSSPSRSSSAVKSSASTTSGAGYTVSRFRYWLVATSMVIICYCIYA